MIRHPVKITLLPSINPFFQLPSKTKRTVCFSYTKASVILEVVEILVCISALKIFHVTQHTPRYHAHQSAALSSLIFYTIGGSLPLAFHCPTGSVASLLTMPPYPEASHGQPRWILSSRLISLLMCPFFPAGHSIISERKGEGQRVMAAATLRLQLIYLYKISVKFNNVSVNRWDYLRCLGNSETQGWAG